MTNFIRRHPNPTPAYEDAGLFKNEVCEVIVDLVPIFARNSREDVVVAGYVGGDLDIAVVFAGRRVAPARMLILALKARKTNAQRQAAFSGLPPVDLTTIRHPVWIEGAWRSEYNIDPEGWDKRTHHFMAARWSFRDVHGNTVQSGSVPELGVPTPQPADH